MKIILGETEGFSKAGYGLPALLKSAETPGKQKYFPVLSVLNARFPSGDEIVADIRLQFWAEALVQEPLGNPSP